MAIIREIEIKNRHIIRALDYLDGKFSKVLERIPSTHCRIVKGETTLVELKIGPRDITEGTTIVMGIMTAKGSTDPSEHLREIDINKVITTAKGKLPAWLQKCL